MFRDAPLLLGLGFALVGIVMLKVDRSTGIFLVTMGVGYALGRMSSLH